MKSITEVAAVRERAAAQGVALVSRMPKEFAGDPQAPIAKWGKLVRESGMVNN